MSRRARVAALLLLVGLVILVMTLAKAEPVFSFDLPPGPAPEMLTTWARQAHMQALFDYNEVHERLTHRVRGSFTAAESARRMLAGTGIVLEHVNAQTVIFTLERPTGS